jgi:ribosomal protein S13
VELREIAERFDLVYTRMTLVQRRLIAARRDDGTSTDQDLLDKAEALCTAIEAALDAQNAFSPSAAELEARAVRRKVLQRPVNAALLAAVLRSTVRRQGFPLLADAIRVSAGELPSALGRRRLGEMLAAPIGMGERTARALCVHWQLDPDARIDALSDAELASLPDQLDEAADRLPSEARKARGQRPAAPSDGIGAGRLVLDAWVEYTGPPLEGIRPLAFEMSKREAWPADAVPIARRLWKFTFEVLLPAALQEWNQIQAIDDDRERLKAIKSQAAAWGWRGEADEDVNWKWVILRIAEEVLDAAIRLDGLNGNYTAKSGSHTAMALTRRIARGCGQLLSGIEPDDAALLIETLKT